MEVEQQSEVIRIKFNDSHQVFEPIVKAYFERNHLTLKNPRNAFDHPTDIQEKITEQLDLITFIFLVPKALPLIQFQDKLIIANFKNSLQGDPLGLFIYNVISLGEGGYLIVVQSLKNKCS